MFTTRFPTPECTMPLSISIFPLQTWRTHWRRSSTLGKPKFDVSKDYPKPVAILCSRCQLDILFIQLSSTCFLSYHILAGSSDMTMMSKNICIFLCCYITPAASSICLQIYTLFNFTLSTQHTSSSSAAALDRALGRLTCWGQHLLTCPAQSRACRDSDVSQKLAAAARRHQEVCNCVLWPGFASSTQVSVVPVKTTCPSVDCIRETLTSSISGIMRVMRMCFNTKQST